MIFEKGQTLSPEQAMRLAIETAKRGRGFVSPNPLVGCVILDKNSKLIAVAAHEKNGEAHAEVNALNQVEDVSLLDGASLYVTLEPCSHQGRTGSCAEKLAKLPLRKVYYGVQDPNPLVSGQGVEHLHQNNLLVGPFSQYEQECQDLIEPFRYHINHQSPYIALKMAVSLDGNMALKNGESQWVTGEEARQLSRQLRGHYDATMIGAGTFQYDDPKLDFRGTDFEGKKANKIVILDPKGKGAQKFKDSQIAQIHDPKNVFILTRLEHIEAWSKNLVHVVRWESGPQAWRQSLQNLYQKGIYSLFVEGGSYVFGQMLSFQLPQKLYMFQSAKIFGDGLHWSHKLHIDQIASAPRLERWTSIPLGDDRLNTGYFVYDSPS